MKNKIQIILLLATIAIFLVITAYGFYKIEYQGNNQTREMIQKADMGKIYNQYITTNPKIDGRAYYGQENASITMIVYLDPSSEASKRFMNQTFKQIKDEYIHTGKIKFYQKNYLTAQDYNEKNEKFIYAQSQLCYYWLKKQDYYDFYFELFSTETDQIPGLVKEYNISLKEFNTCLKEKDFSEIRTDMAEIDNYGIIGEPRIYLGLLGKDNTVIDGIPTQQKIKREIRNYQTLIGQE